ncbi:MAG: glutamate 5-kinase [Chitinispirillaceae bacterium]|nr:glutamate 5-kinase [Chitinispirillaceae bacterium]
MLFRKEIEKVKTIVIKIGSRILTADGYKQRLSHLVEDIAELHKHDIRVILVSSGAIAHGMNVLKMQKRPTTIPLKQACAAIGQNKLMQIYDQQFSKYSIVIGQVLLTWDDLKSKKRYLNLRNTFFQLLDHKSIPIVNENDSVGVEEIRFGNNDILGAQVALLAQADVFVNLTDVGGLYDKNPHTDKTARHIPVVSQLSSTIHQLASEKKSEISVGGMSTKLKAAEIVTRAGIYSIIGDGYDQRIRDVILHQYCATLFLPSKKRMSSLRRWIAFSGTSAGKVTVDAGAADAILKMGKSLLPAGIKRCDGTFKSGDMVQICNEQNQPIAKGLANYTADEISLIAGCKTGQIMEKLGHKSFDEVIHRDNMVLI